MAFGTYSDVEPLENANGLVNKDTLYTTTLDPTDATILDAGAIDDTLNVRTVIRQGTALIVAVNSAQDGLEITEIETDGNETTPNACLITEINFLGTGTGTPLVLDRQGNPLDVQTVAMSLIICANEAGEFYLI